MKKSILILVLSCVLLLSSCTMDATIPENTQTFSYFAENKELFINSTQKLQSLEFDALISRTDFYAPAGSEDFEGLYIQNMENGAFSEYSDPDVQALFDYTDVKLIDFIERDGVVICAFDFCLPTKNFDYGVYYTSENEPIYFGDPSMELLPSGNGFTYEKKASYGAKFTYYTEKIEDNYFYYEIS